MKNPTQCTGDPRCWREVRCCGMCYIHYTRSLRDNPPQEMPYHHPRRWKFTAETWWKWWEERAASEDTLRLRAGIQEFRALLSNPDLR